MYIFLSTQQKVAVETPARCELLFARDGSRDSSVMWVALCKRGSRYSSSMRVARCKRWQQGLFVSLEGSCFWCSTLPLVHQCKFLGCSAWYSTLRLVYLVELWWRWLSSCSSWPGPGQVLLVFGQVQCPAFPPRGEVLFARATAGTPA